MSKITIWFVLGMFVGAIVFLNGIASVQHDV